LIGGQKIVSILHGTGTGKTLIGLQVVLDNQAKKVIWIIPGVSIEEHIEKLIEKNPNINLEMDFPNLEFRT